MKTIPTSFQVCTLPPKKKHFLNFQGCISSDWKNCAFYVYLRQLQKIYSSISFFDAC